MTPELFMRCTGSSAGLALIHAPYATAAMAEFEIDSSRRQATFLAQVGHESGSLVFTREIWGPTPAQVRYEPPCTLAATLGNTQKGDGKRFKGRGPIQITGRSNYRRYGELLGLPLEEFPELLEEPTAGWRAAAAFWQTRGLNELADAGQFLGITKRINGGYNGLDDRERRWARAKLALGVV